MMATHLIKYLKRHPFSDHNMDASPSQLGLSQHIIETSLSSQGHRTVDTSVVRDTVLPHSDIVL